MPDDSESDDNDDDYESDRDRDLRFSKGVFKKIRTVF